MSTFAPSKHSFTPYGDGEGAAVAGEAITAFSALAQAGITASSAKKQQEAQLAHEAATLEGRGQLTALEAQKEAILAQRDEIAARMASFGTKKVLLVVGGLVLISGMIAATVVALKRGN